MRRRNAVRWATWTVACALLVSGCGDDSEQPSANELVDTYGALVESGVERFYVWFTDFAAPQTLEAFGATVIAEFA